MRDEFTRELDYHSSLHQELHAEWKGHDDVAKEYASLKEEIDRLFKKKIQTIKQTISSLEAVTALKLKSVPSASVQELENNLAKECEVLEKQHSDYLADREPFIDAYVAQHVRPAKDAEAEVFERVVPLRTAAAIIENISRPEYGLSKAEQNKCIAECWNIYVNNADDFSPEVRELLLRADVSTEYVKGRVQVYPHSPGQKSFLGYL